MKLYEELPPMPKQEEEAELFRRVREGDVAARNRLILGGMRVMLHVARRHSSNFDEFEEIVSEGAVRLPRCVDLFEPEKGISFFYYVHRSALNAVYTVWKKKTRRIEMISLDAPVKTARPGKELTLAETLAVEGDMVDSILLDEEYAFLRERIKELPAHYEQIVMDYYGFDGREPKLQKELQKELNVCQGGVSRQKKRALNRLRMAMIHDFY